MTMYKTTGTLKEIGAKVGDVFEGGFLSETVVEDWMLSGDNALLGDEYTIISRAAQSPVRTVTKTEIAPGVYGRLAVGNVSYGSVELGIIDDGGDYDLCATLDCDELDTLIQHLQDIREAM